MEQVNPLRSVWASPLYRGATIALFLSGLGMSAAAPQITLFLVNDLHVPLATAGLYYLTNLTAPLAGYLIGARSDRSGKRLGLFRVCALAGFTGWTAMAAANQVWMPFVISALVLGFSGAAGSQLFAAVHDDLRATNSTVSEDVISIVRMALTAGWIVGPVAGSLLSSAAGPRAMLLATGLCTLAQIVPLGMAHTESVQARTPAARKPVQGPGLRRMLPLLAFTSLYVFVYAGEPIKYGYLTIYMRDDLRLPTAVSGAAIGIQPLIELILMPLAVICARRIGMMQLMVLGAGFGVGANLCFALTGTAVGIFAGQILMGGVWGIFAALGGLTGSLGVSALGLPRVFLAPALYALIATIGIAIMSRSRHAVR